MSYHLAVAGRECQGGAEEVHVPTYQYACTECGERLEVVQKFTDDPLTVCDACGGKLRKVFSAVGIVFKGSGFYRTDSRNGAGDGKGKQEDKEPAKDSKPSGSGDGGASGSKSGSSESSGSSGSSGDKAATGSKNGSAGSSPGSSSGSSSGAKVA